MPPVPKLPTQRARGRRRSLALVPAEPRGIEPPPPDRAWLAATASGWREFWAAPVARYVTDSDLAALRRLFELRDMSERFRRAGMRQPTVPGSTGQPSLHPLVKAALEIEPKLVALEDRFGLASRTRLALTVGLGDASRAAADINAEALAPDAAAVDLDALEPAGARR